MSLRRIGLFWFFFIFVTGVPAVASLSPMAALKPTLNQVVDLIGNPDLSGEEHKLERRTKIMSVITQGFDFTEMSKLTIGRTWRDINQQQRDKFVTLFTKLLENAYVGKLEGYGGVTVKFEEEEIKGDKAKVSTSVNDNNVEIPINYIMLQKELEWKVYDINIEGVSLVRNYREQFKSILRKDKFEGLVKVLEEKNASFATGEIE